MEQNKRVGYPLKQCVSEMEAEQLIDRKVPHHIFSVDEVLRPLAAHGSEIMLNSWNYHSVPNHGRPIDYVPDSRAVILPIGSLPSPEEAVRIYTEARGQIAGESSPEGDLLAGNHSLVAQRNSAFWNDIFPGIGSIASVFGDVANGRNMSLRKAILDHIDLSVRMYDSATQ